MVVLKIYFFDLTLFLLIYFQKTFLLKFITCGKHTTSKCTAHWIYPFYSWWTAGSFPAWGLVFNVALTFLRKSLYSSVHSFLLGTHLGAKLLVPRVGRLLSVHWLCQRGFQSGSTYQFSLPSAESSYCPTSTLTHTCIIRILIFNHSVGFIMVSHLICISLLVWKCTFWNVYWTFKDLLLWSAWSGLCPVFFWFAGFFLIL